MAAVRGGLLCSVEKMAVVDSMEGCLDVLVEILHVSCVLRQNAI